ncbi:MAG TPA: class I SAM-dependent methyltransferase [Candidatus Nanoarchaeia archaeon]|nr:class I SAM-dependent methyltransferase [Candidatus Nanoarchaeia archaeon]
MDNKKFLEIKNAYDEFYKGLMKNGKLPMWSTEKGFWNASISDEVYSAFKKIKLQNYKKFLDLGSGDGKIALIASLFCKQAEGIEIDSVLHNKAVEMKQKTGISNVIFHNKDFFEHKLSAYDIIFLAPDAPLERGIENKLVKEMKGKLLHHGHHFEPGILQKKSNFMINGSRFSIYSK